MPNITAEKEEILDEIDSREDVDDLTDEMFDLEREAMKREREVEKSTAPLREQKEELEEQIEEIEGEHEDFIERRRAAIYRRKVAIIEWAQDHEDEVLSDVEGRTYDNAVAEVSFTKKSFNFEWIDKDAVVQALEELGREDLVRVQKKQPLKSTLKQEPDLVRRLDGVEAIEEHDEIDVTLKIG